MDMLTVRPMTSSEFEAFRSRTDREYAAEQVLAGSWTAEEADALSAKLTDELLPQGVDTPRMLLRAAELETVRHGVRAIGLNVFGPNSIARNLYESAGYQVTSMRMHKELPSLG